MTRVLAVGSRVPVGAWLRQPDDDPAVPGPAVEAPGCPPWFAVFAGTAICAPEPESGAGTVPQPAVTAAVTHITSPAEMRSIWASLRQLSLMAGRSSSSYNTWTLLEPRRFPVSGDARCRLGTQMDHVCAAHGLGDQRYTGVQIGGYRASSRLTVIAERDGHGLWRAGVGRDVDRGIGGGSPRSSDRSADARSGGHVLGPGVLATGKRLVASAGSSPSAMTAAVPHPRPTPGQPAGRGSGPGD